VTFILHSRCSFYGVHDQNAYRYGKRKQKVQNNMSFKYITILLEIISIFCFVIRQLELKYHILIIYFNLDDLHKVSFSSSSESAFIECAIDRDMSISVFCSP
jgi:hypothetical protein